MSVDISKRLIIAMDLLDVSFNEVIEDTYISKATLNRYRQGQTQPKIGFIDKFCQVYPINKEWLLHGTSNIYRENTRFLSLNKNNKNIDVSDEDKFKEWRYHRAQEIILNKSNKKRNKRNVLSIIDDVGVIDVVDQNVDIKNNNFNVLYKIPIYNKLFDYIELDKIKAIQIKEHQDQMSPTIVEGDLVLFAPGFTTLPGISPNGIFVLVNNNELSFRRLEIKDNGEIVVSADNKKYVDEFYIPPHLPKYHIVGKVIGIIHQFPLEEISFR